MILYLPLLSVGWKPQSSKQAARSNRTPIRMWVTLFLMTRDRRFTARVRLRMLGGRRLVF
ncbi:hypothetical protein NDA02_20915 [Leptolyngbya sp. ST-U4]|nr:hypothetical protein [Leptolyngbya sp. FACHB-711]